MIARSTDDRYCIHSAFQKETDREALTESNNISIDHGVMVEVLANGQFGYCATHDMSTEAINAAAEKAFIQANQASKFSSTSLASL